MSKQRPHLVQKFNSLSFLHIFLTNGPRTTRAGKLAEQAQLSCRGEVCMDMMSNANRIRSRTRQNTTPGRTLHEADYVMQLSNATRITSHDDGYKVGLSMSRLAWRSRWNRIRKTNVHTQPRWTLARLEVLIMRSAKYKKARIASGFRSNLFTQQGVTKTVAICDPSRFKPPSSSKWITDIIAIKFLNTNYLLTHTNF